MADDAKRPKTGSLPWTRRPADKMLKRLTLREFFGGVKDLRGNNTDGVFPIRVVVLFALILLAGFATWSLLVVLHDVTAVEHRCEKLFTLWPFAVANCAFYWFILMAYFSVYNDVYFVYTVICAICGLAVLVAWCLFVWTNIAPICITFYHFQYPYLYHLFYMCGTLDMVLLMFLGIYECCFVCVKPDGYEDPIMFTSVFYKEDETWVPPLFRAPQVTLYKEGVQKWTKGAYDRVGSLKASESIAQSIKDNSERQSVLLRQVTDLVVETEAKVTKVESAMDEQDELISNFKVSFEHTKEIMDGVADAPNQGFSMCTGWDLCAWLTLVFLCCFSFICVQSAVTKWLSLFGFEGTPAVAE